MSEKKLTIEDYVKMTKKSGIAPIELKFYPIVTIDEAKPIAYRSTTVINSVILGTMEEKDYTYVSDIKDCGVELFKHNIMHVIKAYSRFVEEGRDIQFISTRCPATFSENQSIYDILVEVLDKYPSFDRSKLCIEFTQDLVERDEEKVVTTIKDIRYLKVKSAIVGGGKKDFLLSKLSIIQPDFLILDEEATTQAGSRDKPLMIPALISYVKAMDITTFAEGKDEYRAYLRATECKGFINKYEKPVSLDEAVIYRGEEE